MGGVESTTRRLKSSRKWPLSVASMLHLTISPSESHGSHTVMQYGEIVELLSAEHGFEWGLA